MNYIDNYEKWLLQKGVTNEKGIPTNPMSKSTVRNKIAAIRKILYDLGYVKKEIIKCDPKNKVTKKNGNPWKRFKYLVHSDTHPEIKQINKISIPEIEEYFDNQFTNLNDHQEIKNKRHYVFTIWKFAEFLTFKLGYWTENKLKRLKIKISTPKVKQRNIKTISPQKVDQFINYLHDENYKLFAMLYISRWIGGMRYGEVIRIRRDFKGHGGESGTFDYDMKSDIAVVYGKGQGGFNKERESTITPEVRLVLKQILKWRNNIDNNSDWLFINMMGDRMSDSSNFVNRESKKLAKKSGLFSDREIPMIKFHALGRHTFGTWFYGHIPDKVLMEEMGHERIQTTLGYAQTEHIENRAELFSKARKEEMPEPKKGTNSNNDKVGMIKELLGDLSKEDKIKILAEIL